MNLIKPARFNLEKIKDKELLNAIEKSGMGFKKYVLMLYDFYEQNKDIKKILECYLSNIKVLPSEEKISEIKEPKEDIDNFIAQL